MKNKIVAGFLALFFGIFGVHRFYLGKRFWGILHLLLFFFTLALTVDNEGPFIMAPAILGFIDALLLFAMPVEDFDDRYNAKRIREFQRYRQNAESQVPVQDESFKTAAKPASSEAFLKRMGVEKFRSGDFFGAVEAFRKGLEESADSPALHYNLACCYSMMHDAPSAYEHLEKAVARGFSDLQRIHNHSALHFLRTQPDFDRFVSNKYKRTAALPQPETTNHLLDSKPTIEPQKVIDEIFHLGELMEKGLLSEEEFKREKKKLLSD